jgi:hypothetical protein
MTGAGPGGGPGAGASIGGASAGGRASTGGGASAGGSGADGSTGAGGAPGGSGLNVLPCVGGTLAVGDGVDDADVAGCPGRCWLLSVWLVEDDPDEEDDEPDPESYVES